MFPGIRHSIGEHFLKKEIEGKSRAVIAKNFSDIQKIGIIFSIENESDFKMVKGFIQFFREEGIKKVKAIGYYDGKVNPHYLLPSLDFDFINKQDLNWYYKPSGVAVDNFKADDFDVVVDMTSGECFPMKFLLASTSAKLKVGRFSEKEQNRYDLMIDADKSKGMDYFMEQVNHYLHIINKPTTNVEQI
ncbi:MAG: hypothetical protein JKY42_02675 [Flavobacteriales bacterium]|nr:hypothetical protein [Flavobacteriales bacterium]